MIQRTLVRYRLPLVLPVVVSWMGGSWPRRWQYTTTACEAFLIRNSNKQISTTTTTTRRTASLKSLSSSTIHPIGDSSEAVKKNVLVCGDGDLSFSAWLAPQLHAQGITLTATVLEEQTVHHAVYRNSQKHCAHIESYPGHQVLFGVDATNLTVHLATTDCRYFDVILFNFPHWRGKANHRRNRELLNGFFQSASQVLMRSNGQIHVALCQGQGGSSCSTANEWRQSWMAALYAAEHGLLLSQVVPYQPAYDLSSHRGVDRPFWIGDAPKLYQFIVPNGSTSIDKSLQLCCRHELHLVVPETSNNGSSFGFTTREGLIHGDDLLRFVESLVPRGIRVEIPLRRPQPVLASDDDNNNKNTTMMVFLIVYCGEQVPLTRANADSYRATLEREISAHVPLRENRAGRMVSRPFPYPLLQHFLDEYHANESIETV